VDGDPAVTDSAPLDATQKDEKEARVPIVAKEYILTRREQRFAVLQYVDDIEVTETITYFLNFCRDMGWSVEIIQ
jgi:hypothetical protein